MDIESDDQLEIYLKVCRHLRRLVGGCYERDVSEATPTLEVVEREQRVQIRVENQNDDTVTVETSCGVAAPMSSRDAIEDTDLESSESAAAADRRRQPGLEDKSAAALTALNRPGRLVTYALDGPSSVKVTHALLGDFVTETRLRRDVRAVARAGARLEATSLRRDAATHRPGADIVELVARHEAEMLGREIPTLETWSTSLVDRELPALDVRLERVLRRQFGGSYVAGPRPGGHMVDRYGHAVRLQVQRHGDGLAISVSACLVRNAWLEGFHRRLLHMSGRVPLGAFYAEDGTVGFGYCVPIDRRVDAREIGVVVDHVAGTAAERALSLSVRTCGVCAGLVDEPPDEPFVWV